MNAYNEHVEKKAVLENKIYQNFQSKDFLSNFYLIHEYVNKYTKLIYNEGERWNRKESELNSYEDVHKGSKDDNKKRKKEKKKMIFHLIPSENSVFHRLVKQKKEEVLQKYGSDDTYKYDVHISLTGYFLCNNKSRFLTTFSIYLFYYIKSHYIYNNILMNVCFIRIDREKDFYNFYKQYCNETKEKTSIEPLTKMKNSTKEKAVIKESSEENKKPSDYYIHMLATDDGYVIAPIMCDWITAILKNFCFIIKNNNFTLSNKKDPLVTKKRRNVSCTSVHDTNCLYCYSNTPVGKDRSSHVTTRLDDRNEQTLSEISNKEESYQFFQQKKKGGKWNTFENMFQKEKMENGYFCKLSKKKVHLNNNDYYYKENNDYYNEENNDYYNEENNDKNMEADGVSCDRKDKCHNHIKRKLITESKNFTRKLSIEQNCDNKCIIATKQNEKHKKEEPNKINYKFNNVKVKISEFRIKNKNHISLASNRNEKKIQNDILNIYKDLKFYNCSWDLVLYERKENTDDQKQVGQKFLNEIFRIKKFAVW